MIDYIQSPDWMNCWVNVKMLSKSYPSQIEKKTPARLWMNECTNEWMNSCLDVLLTNKEEVGKSSMIVVYEDSASFYSIIMNRGF